MPAHDSKSPEGLPENLGLDAFRQPAIETGLSLDDLSAAFAEMLSAGDAPYTVREPGGRLDGNTDALPSAAAEPWAALAAKASQPAEAQQPAEALTDDACQVTPRSILEAMLFVGSPDNQPLAAERVAGLMRGVRPAEIEDLVRELNEQYAASGRAYEIKSEGAGYRMALRGEYGRVRDKFYGRVRQARLSPAAVEVLSIIAYNGPQTPDEGPRLGAPPGGPILSQLVRRQLLALERTESSPRRVLYRTTQRFLDLFGLQSLDDLPRSQELDRR